MTFNIEATTFHAWNIEHASKSHALITPFLIENHLNDLLLISQANPKPQHFPQHFPNPTLSPTFVLQIPALSPTPSTLFLEQCVLIHAGLFW